MHAPAPRVLLLLLLAVFLAVVSDPAPGRAAQKVFVREYSYRASDDDSKNSARRKALEQLRAELLREVGVYLQAYLEIESRSDREFVAEEIRTVTAGIARTEILEEAWDGSFFYVKAQIELDTEDVLRSLNRALEERSSSAELQRLSALLATANAEASSRAEEVERLKAQVDARNATIRDQESRLQELEQDLERAERRLVQVDRAQRVVQSKLEQILRDIDRMTEEALAAYRPGLTFDEIRSLIGEPRATKWCGISINRRARNYGDVWLVSDGSTDILQCLARPGTHGSPCRRCEQP